jgi:hypothetical protein
MRMRMGWMFKELCRWEVGVQYRLSRTVTLSEIKFSIFFIMTLDCVLLELLSVGFANIQK